MIKCGKCGASYRRKHNNAGSKYEKIVWICATYNLQGKTLCDSQQIPEDILYEKVAEIGGLDLIKQITVPDKNKLIFHMKNGEEKETQWQNPSRRESWTPEKRELARQRALERRKLNGET